MKNRLYKIYHKPYLISHTKMFAMKGYEDYLSHLKRDLARQIGEAIMADAEIIESETQSECRKIEIFQYVLTPEQKRGLDCLVDQISHRDSNETVPIKWIEDWLNCKPKGE